MAYIDFSRAFDSVSHEKLFARLYIYGIQGDLLCWIRNFFVGRSHHTKVGLCLSDVVALLSGVIQGSGIGPLMFLIYIDDLAKLGYLSDKESQPNCLLMMLRCILMSLVTVYICRRHLISLLVGLRNGSCLYLWVSAVYSLSIVFTTEFAIIWMALSYHKVTYAATLVLPSRPTCHRRNISVK